MSPGRSIRLVLTPITIFSYVIECNSLQIYSMSLFFIWSLSYHIFIDYRNQKSVDLTFCNKLKVARKSLFGDILSICMEDEGKTIIQGNPQPGGYFSTIPSSKGSFNEAFVLRLPKLGEEVQILMKTLGWCSCKQISFSNISILDTML